MVVVSWWLLCWGLLKLVGWGGQRSITRTVARGAKVGGDSGRLSGDKRRRRQQHRRRRPRPYLCIDITGYTFKCMQHDAATPAARLQLPHERHALVAARDDGLRRRKAVVACAGRLGERGHADRVDDARVALELGDERAGPHVPCLEGAVGRRRGDKVHCWCWVCGERRDGLLWCVSKPPSPYSQLHNSRRASTPRALVQ